MLLAGKYNHLCGVERLDEHFDGAQQTFPKLLQQAGYETAIGDSARDTALMHQAYMR